MFLRYAPPLAGLRRVPVLGACARWAGAKLFPRDALAWVQVQQGPGQGLWLHLHPRTGRDYFEGSLEPEVQDALVQNLRSGMVFYDLGANIGFFSLLAARLVGQEGHVVGFEPDPEVAERLREHIMHNNLSWIVAEERAVWSESQPITFVRADPASSPERGLGRVDQRGTENGAIQILATSLDDYALTFPQPDFIKCDVEGAEVQVFRGARRLLATKRPGILCEMHSEGNRHTLSEEFAGLGYSCRPCSKSHVLALPQ